MDMIAAEDYDTPREPKRTRRPRLITASVSTAAAWPRRIPYPGLHLELGAQGGGAGAGAVRSCVAAASASAQGDRVFVDPDSPSGREYELPVDSARQQGAKTPRTAGAPAPAPLFGEGVERRHRDPAATAGDQTGTTRGGRDAESRDVAGAARSQRATSPHETQAAAPSGAGGLATIIGAGGAVLLIGGLAGLWLRRRAAGDS